jgi:hypothetical protein
MVRAAIQGSHKDEDGESSHALLDSENDSDWTDARRTHWTLLLDTPVVGELDAKTVARPSATALPSPWPCAVKRLSCLKLSEDENCYEVPLNAQWTTVAATVDTATCADACG